MATHYLQATFGKGELSPRLLGRVDTEAYKMAAEIARNWIVLRQGGITRRPGTWFVGPVIDHSRPAKLIPFTAAGQQAYMLVLNAGRLRAYTPFQDTPSVDIPHPWADADLFALDYDQTNDVMDVTHRAYAPRRISRLSHTNWTISTTEFRDGPYLPIGADIASITPSATGNAVPRMTSATAPSGSVAASGSASGFQAWQAFDRNPRSYWFSAAGSAADISYTFAAPKVIRAYQLQAAAAFGAVSGAEAAARAPQSWTFEGFDGTNWVGLDSQFGQTNWSTGEGRTFTIINSTAYSAYRLNVTSNNGGEYVGLAEFAMVEDGTTITLTASGLAGVNKGAGFGASDVGRVIALLGANAVYQPFRITAVISATVVTVALEGGALPNTSSSRQWKLGAWYGPGNWPAKVCTFEGRKAFARTDEQPSTVWLTRSGGYGDTLDFSVKVPTAEDDAISLTFADVSEIQWIAEGPDLFVGTASAARYMGRDSPNLGFSAKNFRQSRASTTGSEGIRPVQSGSSVIFVERFARALYEFLRTDDGGFTARDMSIWSDHLFKSGIIEACYQQVPDSIVWACMADGSLAGMTYERGQETQAIHGHSLGGDGKVESIATIPGDGRHELWLIVRRVINGQTVRYIERMAARFDAQLHAQAEAVFVDCARRYSGVATLTMTGLGHLEGQTAAILADGGTERPAAVTGGQVAVNPDKPASTIIAGLPYRSVLRTLRNPLSVGDGTGLGRKRKVMGAAVDLLETGQIKVGRPGSPDSQLETVTLRRTSNLLGHAVPLAEGMHDSIPQTSWSDSGQIELIADGPQACTVRALRLVLETEP